MTALIELYKTDHASLVSWVCKTYGIGQSGVDQFGNVHRVRRETIARRLRLYRDQARVDVEGVISAVYETDEYKATLKRYVPFALEQNVSRRIVDEIASLYDRPALRLLATDDERFHTEEKRLRLHEIMQEGHRLLTLCNEVLVWQFRGANEKDRLRLVTPDTFDAIPHPRDNLIEAGLLLDVCPTTVLQGNARNALPHFEIWDDTYRYLISGTGQLVDELGQYVKEPAPHGLGRIPGVLMHRREPTVALLDASHGSDIESAHRGVALLNVMILRLSKSQGENQPVLTGNVAAMMSGQVMNGEKPLILPPEVVASMLSMQTDPDHYLSVKRDKITSVAQTYGMSYEQFTFTESSDAGSGKSYAMRREKLTEIRLKSRRRAVVHEGEIVALMGFDADGLRLDYQEQAIPTDATEELTLLRERMKLGLDSPITFMQRKDSDLDRKGAIERMHENLRDYAVLIEWVRALNAPADGDASNPGQSPQENGAMGGGGNSLIIGADGASADNTTNPASGAKTHNPATGRPTA